MNIKLLAILQIAFLLISTTSTTRLKSIQYLKPSLSAAKLLADIQNEKNFSTLVIWRREPDDCFSAPTSWSTDNHYGYLIFSDNYTTYLNAHYKRELLNVVCLRDFVDFPLLDNMAESLEHMRETRILFLLKNFTISEADDFEELFSYCDQQQMLNVLAVREDFERNGDFYSFKRFPNFTVQRTQWPSIYYPNRLRDLQGYALRSIPSQSEPGSIVYKDREGRKRSSGYIYHLISTFAWKLNASLRFKNRVHVGERIAVSILQDLTRNYELDLPICLQMRVENESAYAYSDVVDISAWMPMLPGGGYIERYKIYEILFTNPNLIIDVIIFIMLSLIYNAICSEMRCPLTAPANAAIFNDKIFRGVIGLPYKMRKKINIKLFLIYALIFVQGTVWSADYSRHVHTSFSRPPASAQINSFDDLKARRIQIAIPEEHFVVLEKIMPDSFKRQYSDLFLIIHDLRDFYALRQSFSTNFAYSVHSDIWSMIDRQQHYFTQRLFRISEGVTFHRHMPLAVPLAENCVYRATFNAYLLDIKANGLWQHWTDMSLYEMTQAGKIVFEDLTKSFGYQSLCVHDLYYIWLFYIGGNILCCCCILVEILYRKLKHVNLGRVIQQYLIDLWNALAF